MIVRFVSILAMILVVFGMSLLLISAIGIIFGIIFGA
jgi:hypothetical protein